MPGRLGRFLSERFTREESRADIRRTRGDGLAHNAGSPAADDSRDPAPLPKNALRAHSIENKVRRCSAYEAMEALTQARERQEEARRLYPQKCEEAAVAETMFNDTMKDTPKNFKTVTMRADPLLTTARLLLNDPRAARRSPEPLERQFSTTEFSAAFQSQPLSCQRMSSMSNEYGSEHHQ